MKSHSSSRGASALDDVSPRLDCRPVTPNSGFHVALKADDVDAAAAFHEDSLDGTVIERGHADEGEGATAVEHAGLTGGRRHLLARHLAEHPAFDCELVARQPLTARKSNDAPEAKR